VECVGLGFSPLSTSLTMTAVTAVAATITVTESTHCHHCMYWTNKTLIEFANRPEKDAIFPSTDTYPIAVVG